MYIKIFSTNCNLKRSEILTTVLPKIRVFWDVTLRRVVNSHRRYERWYCYNIQGQTKRSTWRLRCLRPEYSNRNISVLILTVDLVLIRHQEVKKFVYIQRQSYMFCHGHQDQERENYEAVT